jgi:protein TonB
MPSPTFRPFAGFERPALSRRAIALLLAIAIHGLLILMLLTLAPDLVRPKKEKRDPVSFSLAPSPAPVAAREKKVARKQTQKALTPAPKATPSPPATETPPTPELPFVVLSRQDFAGADIGKLPSRDRGGAQAGSDSGAAQGPGEGPGGEQLFNADWQRRPTNAELATYMPPNAPPHGWGMVACRTIENYQVENCRQLGESPVGSGFARAVRLAAWQFRVVPPRIGGRPQVGAWVRIRIDYIQGIAQ